MTLSVFSFIITIHWFFQLCFGGRGINSRFSPRAPYQSLPINSCISPGHAICPCVRVSVYIRKVDIHQKTCEGSTPLHFACKQKNEAIVRLLLEYGAGDEIFSVLVLSELCEVINLSVDPNVLNDPNPPADQQADRVMIRGNPLHVAMHHYAVDCMYSILESPRL